MNKHRYYTHKKHREKYLRQIHGLKSSSSLNANIMHAIRYEIRNLTIIDLLYIHAHNYISNKGANVQDVLTQSNLCMYAHFLTLFWALMLAPLSTSRATTSGEETAAIRGVDPPYQRHTAFIHIYIHTILPYHQEE